MCWLLLLRQQAVNCNNTILLVWLCGLLVLELVEVKVQFGFFFVDCSSPRDNERWFSTLHWREETVPPLFFPVIHSVTFYLSIWAQREPGNRATNPFRFQLVRLPISTQWHASVIKKFLWTIRFTITFMKPLATVTQSHSICRLLIVHTRLLRSFS